MLSLPVAAASFPELPVRFQRLMLADGLSQSSILSVYQDSRGFIWMGTQDGLNRYDGRRIVSFKADPEDPHSLSSSNIWCITEDSHGDLWVGTEGGGFDQFHRDTETFTQFRHGPGSQEAGRFYDVRSILADSSGCIWMGTHGDGLLRFDPGSQDLTAYNHDPADPGSLPSNDVQVVLRGGDGRIWAGTTAGLSVLDPVTGDITTFVANETATGRPDHSLPKGEIRALSPSLQGGIWVGTSTGLARLDEKTGRVLDRPDVRGTGLPKSMSVVAMQELATGVLWVGSAHQGAFRVRLDSGHWNWFRNDPQNPASLSDDEVYAIILDYTGVVWIGTSNGANRLDSRAKQFYHFLNKPGDPAGLSNDCVWSICEDRKGSVWSVTESGVNILDPGTGLMTQVFADKSDPHKPSYDSFIEVVEDSQGGIWLGARDGALNRYDPETGVYTRFPPDPTNPRAIADDRVFAIACDRRGRVWIGTMTGLECYDPGTGLFRRFRNDPLDSGSIPAGSVRDLFVDRKDRLWMSLWGSGVGYLDLATERVHHYDHHDEDRTSLSSNTVLSVIADRRGRVWVGTSTGLNLLDPETGLCRRYTMKDGLPNNTIYRIEEDREGGLWVSTNFGLARFQPDTGEVRTYVDRDGIQNNEFNMGASHVGRSGRMYFGGIQGFNAFYPDSIRNNPIPPRIVLTDFRIFNKTVPIGPMPDGRTVLDKAVSEVDHIELTSRDHVISFEFADLHFASPLKNNFAYIMEGFEDRWNEVGNRNHATYTNLPPGHYVFRVRGSNNDGVWDNEGLAVAITVTPPFYRTAWFIAAGTLFIVGLVYGLHRYRMRLLDVKNRLLEQRVAERTSDLTFANQALQQEIDVRKRIESELREARNKAVAATKAKSEFLANMSHEIRTPMNGVLGMTSILLDTDLSGDQRDYAETVHSSAENLLSIINDILDFSKVEAGKLQLEHTEFDLFSLLDRVTKTLGYKAQVKGLHFTCEIEGPVPRRLKGDPGRLTQILVNLANNAVKFTTAGRVLVKVSCPATGGGLADLHFTVQDTGIGIPADRLDKVFESFTQVDASVTRKYGGTGLGLTIVHQLVNLMDGRVSVESVDGEGTTFHVMVTLETCGPAAPPRFEAKVLVVHGQAEAGASVGRILAGMGCRARVVPPAEAAAVFGKASAVGDSWDLVLADQAGDEAGIAALVAQLRNLSGKDELQVHLLCRQGEGIPGEKLDAMGLSGYLTVPPLYEKLEKMLAGWGDPAQGQGTTGENPNSAPGSEEAAEVEKPLILLAEDNPVNQKVAQLMLAKLGYRVDLAENGLEVLEAVAKKDYAAVLLDVQMPEMDGLEAARRIRAADSPARNPRVPLIALTANAMPQDRQSSLDAGMDDHLAKPIDSQLLRKVLQGLIDVNYAEKDSPPWETTLV